MRYHAAVPDRACGALIVASPGRSVARRDAIYSDSRCACSLCPCAVLHGRDTPERPQGTGCEPFFGGKRSQSGAQAEERGNPKAPNAHPTFRVFRSTLVAEVPAGTSPTRQYSSHACVRACVRSCMSFVLSVRVRKHSTPPTYALYTCARAYTIVPMQHPVHRWSKYKKRISRSCARARRCIARQLQPLPRCNANGCGRLRQPRHGTAVQLTRGDGQSDGAAHHRTAAHVEAPPPKSSCNMQHMRSGMQPDAQYATRHATWRVA